MRELARLMEMLRVDPGIAEHIRSFSWIWLMGGDYHKMNHYDASEGSLLDMAFKDRKQMWDELGAQNAKEISTDVGGSARSVAFFNLKNAAGKEVTFEEPGWQSTDGEEDEEFEAEWEGDQNELFGWSYSFIEAVGGDGPDGYGPNKLIESPAEL